ncbi:MAG: hypothetical protein NC231_12440 [Bacillus sp. (in: Bacteria)]|nr:hypothetical protein [Bacillus sp. (in: firmicutes)]MCM1425421.1 hypothetical protein [Eubacterium sp.]
MQNKENGNYRPTFYCMRDEKTSLLWLVPLSSRVEKFQMIYDKQIEKYGNCLTIVMGEYDGNKHKDETHSTASCPREKNCFSRYLKA